MRILLAHNSTYFPAHGGGDVSNRLLIEALAARGHECLVVCRTAAHGSDAHRQLLAKLAERDIPATVPETGIVRFRLNTVDVHTATETPNLRDAFTRRLQTLRPDVVIASTDDSAQILLQTALDSGVPVVYLARATIALPFGPDCAFPSAAKTAAMRRARAVVGVSRYVADYIRQWSGIEAEALPISFMGPGPFPELGEFSNEFVTLANPCVVKGIDIFVGMADALPHLKFAAVPTWGTNESDFAKLRARTNIEILDPVEDIDRILSRTRVLLVPSVWAEARSRMVMEAMLRGVPVIASNTGGLPEAKLGVPYVLPVEPIPKYSGSLDERMVPVAEAPPQNLGPWVEALCKLTADPEHWEEISSASRHAALRFHREELRIEPFENLVLNLGSTKVATGRAGALEKLSVDQRRLLALKLMEQKPREQILTPPELPNSRTAVICFPWAGAGPRAYQPVMARLDAEGFGGASIRYPAGPDSVAAIVDQVLDKIAPKLPTGFVLFGHSMGAGIAFEFARALRSRGLPAPKALFVSSATAPQLRTVSRPDPTREELLKILASQLSGNAGDLTPFLPAFEKDTRIYRGYLYQEGAPFDFPIFAYRGENDSVGASELEAWSEQTIGKFSSRTFPGGHSHILEAGTGFPQALVEDLKHALG